MSASTPPPAPAPALPSTHVRVLITWTAIFPLVTAGTALLAPLTSGWPLIAQTALLTALVVPLAVYLVVPALMRARGRFLRRGHARRATMPTLPLSEAP